MIWKISIDACRTLLRAAVLALCALPMYCQTADSGAITGTVIDPSGALVSHAAVVVNSQGTGEKRDLATDGEGNFSVPFLTPGSYDLTVRVTGFEPLVLKGVQVRITDVSRVRIQLAIGGAKEQITVSAKPPLIQTENATLGRVIDHATIVDLPLVNRNFTEILGLTAGTNTDIVDATQLGAGSQEIRTNGARSGDNNFMLNGVDANSYSSDITEVTPFGGAGVAIPAPDTLQEFKVQTSLYDAQYGRGVATRVIQSCSLTGNGERLARCSSGQKVDCSHIVFTYLCEIARIDDSAIGRQSNDVANGCRALLRFLARSRIMRTRHVNRPRCAIARA